jgi:hypothetical protein
MLLLVLPPQQLLGNLGKTMGLHMSLGIIRDTTVGHFMDTALLPNPPKGDKQNTISSSSSSSRRCPNKHQSQ